MTTILINFGAVYHLSLCMYNLNQAIINLKAQPEEWCI
jgi:hypothetical protein